MNPELAVVKEQPRRTTRRAAHRSKKAAKPDHSSRQRPVASAAVEQAAEQAR